MIDWIIWVVLAVLILASYLDLKYKAVPSLILTGLIFIVLLLRPENLIFGVAGLVLGIFMKDLISSYTGFDFGMADIKILIIFGLLISTLQGFFLLIGVFAIFQFVYTLLWRWKINKDGEMAFVPCLLAIYICLMILGVVA